jgi:hypothetical protein
MSKQSRIYYFAVWLLWCANALFHELDVDGHLSSPEVLRRTNLWNPIDMVLINWLSHERFIPIEAETMKYDEEQELYRVSEDIGDALDVRWRDQFLRVANQAYEDFPEMDKAVHLYFYYCRWLLKTLSRFDDILQTPDM